MKIINGLTSCWSSRYPSSLWCLQPRISTSHQPLSLDFPHTPRSSPQTGGRGCAEILLEAGQGWSRRRRKGEGTIQRRRGSRHQSLQQLTDLVHDTRLIDKDSTGIMKTFCWHSGLNERIRGRVCCIANCKQFILLCKVKPASTDSLIGAMEGPWSGHLSLSHVLSVEDGHTNLSRWLKQIGSPGLDSRWFH